MRGSAIDVMSSRLIAGIVALRRTFGLEQDAQGGPAPLRRLPKGAEPLDINLGARDNQAGQDRQIGAQQTQTTAAVQPVATTQASAAVAAPTASPTVASVSAPSTVTTASGLVAHFKVPARFVNPTRQWIDFSHVEFDLSAPRGTYLSIDV